MTDDQATAEAATRGQLDEFNRGRTRQLVIASVLVALVALAIAVWTLTRPDERSTKVIEQQIQSWADSKTQGGGPISVTCPDPIEWRVGQSFHCIITQDEQSLGVSVTMENDEGDVTWQTG